MVDSRNECLEDRVDYLQKQVVILSTCVAELIRHQGEINTTVYEALYKSSFQNGNKSKEYLDTLTRIPDAVIIFKNNIADIAKS